MPTPFLTRSLCSLAAAAAVACASTPSPGDRDGGGQASLVPCTPTAADASARDIGPRGGVVRSGDARLMVPQGALSAARRVSLAHETGPYRVVRAEIADPPGRQPANRSYILTLSYDDCELGGREPTILHLDDEGHGIAEDVGGAVDAEARTVTVALDHLSRYAIGSN